VILNVLLPLQMFSGLLMWGAQSWPDAVRAIGGLPTLARVHTLGAWLFAAFLIAHVYLTTTGPTPLAMIRAMIVGWDESEETYVAADYPAFAEQNAG
jgi:thiosulfate reductase cytochrome b subunit